MAKRITKRKPTKRKVAKRKVAKRKPVKRKVAKRKVKKSKTSGGPAFNRAAYHKAFKQLQQQVDKAWKKFCSDKKSKANESVMADDHKDLLLLLGECNYFVRECMRMSGKTESLEIPFPKSP